MDNNLISELDEKRVDELLVYAPAYSAQNSDNIKKLFMEKTTVSHETGKRIVGKRVLLAAAIAAVVVALSGIVLAVYTGFDLGRLFNSLFNNPATEEYRIDVGQTEATGDLEITVVSAYVDGSKIYAMLEISDPVGNRLSDSMRILNNNLLGLFTSAVSYDEVENKAALVVTLYMAGPVELGSQIDFSIDAILSGIEYISHQPIDFDIAAHICVGETVSMEEWLESIIISPKDSISSGTSGDVNEDARFLKTGAMAVEIPGIDWAIMTNVGMIEGMLHLQMEYTDKWNHDYNYGSFSLLDGDGNNIEYSRHIDKGNYTQGSYQELVFDIGDNAELSSFRLAFSGVRVEHIIAGTWEVGFAVDRLLPSVAMTAFPQDSPYFTELDITCSPMTTSIRAATANPENPDWGDRSSSEILAVMDKYIQGMMDYVNGFEPPHLILTDGSIVPIERLNSMYDYYCGDIWGESLFFDIDKLFSITFCGEVYEFSR